MSDDIVTRQEQEIDFVEYLRLWASPDGNDQAVRDLHKAADEIERLREWAAYEHAGYCGCAGGDKECVNRAYTTWKKMFGD